MDTTIKIQQPFSYSVIPILILLLIMLALVFLMFQVNREKKEKRAPKKDDKMSPFLPPTNREQVRARYFAMLTEIERDFYEEKISVRDCYQRLSSCVRGFIGEMTGVPAANLTLTSIQKIRMPILEDLVSEYYEPEFATKTSADARSSIEKAKRVIGQWK